MKVKQTSIFQYESQTQFPVEKISGPADLLESLLQLCFNFREYNFT